MDYTGSGGKSGYGRCVNRLNITRQSPEDTPVDRPTQRSSRRAPFGGPELGLIAAILVLIGGLMMRTPLGLVLVVMALGVVLYYIYRRARSTGEK